MQTGIIAAAFLTMAFLQFEGRKLRHRLGRLEFKTCSTSGDNPPLQGYLSAPPSRPRACHFNYCVVYSHMTGKKSRWRFSNHCYWRPIPFLIQFRCFHPTFGCHCRISRDTEVPCRRRSDPHLSTPTFETDASLIQSEGRRGVGRTERLKLGNRRQIWQLEKLHGIIFRDDGAQVFIWTIRVEEVWVRGDGV